MKRALVAAALLCSAAAAWSGGQGEAASSSARGTYLAGRGIIIPPEEVHINSYIAHIDYTYPDPAGELGVTLYSGHRRLSAGGQEEVIQIGIQGKKMDFAELPPLNLAFVIDTSGSMAAEEKMEWVKEAFDIFIEKVREKDFVSLVSFDDEAEVLFPTRRMASRSRRLALKQAVRSLSPEGGTNLRSGLELGYEQVLANFRSDYTNRVLFLTDGVGFSEGILEMAESYRRLGVGVSTIGVGRDYDLELMVDISRRGGGSSRFISDRTEMEETFGSELDRMVVPVARNLRMELEFLLPIEILGTWGYEHRIDGRSISYAQKTLHHRDYETILAHIRLPAGIPPGEKDLLRFTIDYEDLRGDARRSGPHLLQAEFVETDQPVAGFADARVLKSGTMMRFARHLKEAGELYYSCTGLIEEINRRRDELWRSGGGADEYQEISSAEIRELEEKVGARMRRAMSLTLTMKKEVANARLRLDNVGFEEELGILDHYIRILGRELKWEPAQLQHAAADRELPAPVRERSLANHLANLFDELTFDLRAKELKERSIVAVSGFVPAKGEAAGLVKVLNETALSNLGRIETLTLVERSRLDAVMEEQKLSLAGLTDTSTAIEVGRLLAADYLLTGSVIEMSATVVIFGRIIRVESGEIESVAQVIVPKDRDVQSLL